MGRPCDLSTRQQPDRVYGFTVSSDLKVQINGFCSRAALFCDLLTRPHRVALAHQQAVIMPVSGEVLFVVLDNQLFAKADDSGTGVHHLPCSSSDNRISPLSGNVDAFVETA